MQVGENGIKYSMKISNWPFQSLSNSLFIRTKESAFGDGEGCEGSFSNEGSDLQWMKIFYNGVTLYLSSFILYYIIFLNFICLCFVFVFLVLIVG